MADQNFEKFSIFMKICIWGFRVCWLPICRQNKKIQNDSSNIAIHNFE